MEDVFSMLANGASFGKKRNADSMHVFRQTGKISRTQQVDVPSIEHIAHFEDDDEVNAFRNRLRIKVKGDKVAVPITGFPDMPLHVGIRKAVLTGIEESRWKEPTPIQMQAIPVLLDGRDVLAGAPTGSGKTAAYLLPILSLVSKLSKETKKAVAASASSGGVLGLVLVPTRELAEQIHREVIRLVGTKKIKAVVLTKQVVAR
jgi:ATP-dependent RNA helicase DDX52/ROK1